MNDYITSNVTYDNYHLQNYANSYDKMYTAYAAAIDNTAVCQGYSNLFYRLALEAGVDCRIVSSEGMVHAWNIVKLGNVYYQLDATWDATPDKGTVYFLGGKIFTGHNIPDQFSNIGFADSYPLASTYYGKSNSYVKSPSYTLNTISGTTSSTAADGNKPKIIFFYKTGCYNCTKMLSSMKSKNLSGVDFIVIPISDMTLSDIKSLRADEGNSYMTFCYSSNSTLWNYLYGAGEYVSSVSTPVVAYVSKDNDVLLISKGYDNIELTTEMVLDISLDEAEVKNISTLNVSLASSSYSFTGNLIKPAVTVKDNGRTLTSGVDYKVTYSNNTNVGTGKAVIKGIGLYTGTKTLSFTINKRNLSDCTATLSSSVYTYTGKEIKPANTMAYKDNTLVRGTDYICSYSSNINAGTGTVTFTGKGNYCGTKTKTFKINSKSVSRLQITLGAEKYRYTGSSQRASVAVTDSGAILKKDVDYTLSYSNTVNIGTAKVTINGIGNYTGSVQKAYSIVLGKTSISKKENLTTGIKVTWNKVYGADYYQVYRSLNGGSFSLLSTVSSAYVSYTDKSVSNGSRYEYKIRAYRLTETVRSYSDYSAVAIIYRVNPVAVSSVVKNSASITVKWNSNSVASGYYVYRSVGDGAFTKIATVSGRNSVSYTDSAVSSGKKYTYRVMAYKTVSDVSYTSMTGASKSIVFNKV